MKDGQNTQRKMDQEKKQRDKLFQVVTLIQERNLGVDPEEVMQDVLSAQTEIRK